MGDVKENVLGTQPISKLIRKFSIPAVISMLVGALYNIVDQIFIGQGVGPLGNAATNVAFPLVTICTAIALLIGLGSSSNFNLAMGAKKPERAANIVGNGIALMVIAGFVLMGLVLLFLEPLLMFFGSTKEVLPYALTYTSITALGIPFLIFSTGGGSLVRSDGSPILAMVFTLVGAVINTILDPIFIFKFEMGIAGGAWATVIGQVVSGTLIFIYALRFRTVKLKKENFIIKAENVQRIASLGTAAFINQISMMIVQIVMNNTLRYYGGLSVYGSTTALAVVGIISKINMLFFAFAIGISQGCQPIIGYNYGAKNYKRVKETYKIALRTISIISVVAFACFQLFPRQIISVFGEGDELYYQFGIQFFKIFLFFTFVNGVQPLTANFFTSIGKANKGAFLSLTRQVFFLVPLLIIFPLFWGVEGVLYAGPISDCAAALMALYLVKSEMKELTYLDEKQEEN